MGTHEASQVTLESIRQRMVEVERIHQRGKKVGISDTLMKDIGWLFRRIGFLTNQVRTLESELVAMTAEKKDLANDNVMADRVKMLMKRLEDTEEKLRIAQRESLPFKRENNSLRQEVRLLQAQAQKEEKRAGELAKKVRFYEEKLEGTTSIC